jgi:hypothetical protein
VRFGEEIQTLPRSGSLAENGRAEALDFPDAAFDLVVSYLDGANGEHFSIDRYLIGIARSASTSRRCSRWVCT